MINELKGKTAIVTGASSGIGRETAILLASEGARVALVGRNEGALALTQRHIRDAGGDAEMFPADLSVEREAIECVGRVINKWAGIDVLVNAAGIIGTGSAETTTLSEWDRMLNINLRAIFHLTQLCLPSIVERKGNVVNVSSVTGLRSFPNVLSYAVAKAGLDQLTRCSALELAAKGVRVNAVNPGVAVTNLHRSGGMDEATYAKFIEHSKDTHPLGGAGEARDVAELILFLASDRAKWITGVTYSVDGGRAQTCLR